MGAASLKFLFFVGKMGFHAVILKFIGEKNINNLSKNSGTIEFSENLGCEMWNVKWKPLQDSFTTKRKTVVFKKTFTVWWNNIEIAFLHDVHTNFTEIDLLRFNERRFIWASKTPGGLILQKSTFTHHSVKETTFRSFKELI